MTTISIEYTGPDGWGSAAYPDDAGIDLPIAGRHELLPGESKDLPSGIRLAIPPGFFGRIVGRSSSLRKRGVQVHEGIIDAGFRGELFSFATNVSKMVVLLTSEDRIAQLIITPVVEHYFNRVNELPESARGTNGFGSSDQHQVCHAGSDGDCSWVSCPQVRDGEPRRSGRHCPLDWGDDHTLPMIYLGGPIDHAYDPIIWRAMFTDSARQRGWAVFDPQKENRGIHDPQIVFDHNMLAIRSSAVCLFNFGEEPAGHYGFGSPIEIDYAVKQGRPVVVVHEDNRVGVYLRKYWSDGVIIVPNMAQAIDQIAAELAKQ